MKNKVFPISMALLWGIVYSNVLHSWISGMFIGLMMGMVFGLFDSDKGTDQDEQTGGCEDNFDEYQEMK